MTRDGENLHLAEAEPESGAGYRLSPQQERVLALLAAEPRYGAAAACAVRIIGALEPARLEMALRKLVARWEILRTAFRRPAGLDQPLQQIAEPESLRIEIADKDIGGDRETLRRHLEEVASRVDPTGASGTTPIAVLYRGEEAAHLLLALPALASDAAGLSLLVGELMVLYRSEGSEFRLDEAVQYADICEFVHELAESSDGEVGRDFWRHRIWPSVESQALGVESGRHAPSWIREALRPGQERGVQLRTTEWIALWARFLARLAGVDSVAMSVSTDGRRFEEIATALGLFDRHLPIAIDCAPAGHHWRQTAAEVERSIAAAAERLEVYADRFGPGAGEASICAFGFEHRPVASFDTGDGTHFQVAERKVATDRFRLKLIVEEAEGGASLDLETETLDEATARRLLIAFRDFVSAASSNPLGSLDEIETASSKERAAFELEAEGNRRFRPGSELLHRLVAEQARQTPTAIAISAAGRNLDYRALSAATARLSTRLLEWGVGPGDLVGISVDRSVEMVVGLLAILEAGAAYLPLDPGYPEERLRFMLADSSPILVLTEERYRPLFGTATPRFESLSRLVGEVLEREGSEPRSNPPGDRSARPDPAPESLAYAIYTSGSSGRPKGVLVSHRAISNRLLWMRDVFPLGPGDAVLAKTPLSFDASIWEIFAPLLAGARVVLAEPEGHRDPAYLARVVVEEKITTLQLVPSLLAAMLDEPQTAAWKGTIARLFCGGEALSADIALRAVERLGVELCNLYGPTESAIDATFGLFAEPLETATVPIGRPIENVSVYLVDRAGGRVGAGFPGEIWIGGAGLARGYLGRPDLTSERFTPDPFGVPGGRVFRTGDLARRGSDGRLEFLGRGDQQIKLRGYRIEIQEIEAALERQTGVRRAAVAARRDERDQLFLAAYLVVDPGVAPETVRESLIRELPDYMVPSAWALLDRLPTSPSGKLDRRALPEPRGAAVAPAALATMTEQVIGAIWTEVFGREVGADSDFFDLGGNSLVATQVTSRLRQTLHASLPIRALFEAPVLRNYAMRAEAELKKGVAPPPPLVPVSRIPPLPLSYAQQRLWFLDQLEGGGPSYNLPLAVRLLGELRVDLLASALSEVVGRHEVLRTTIDSVQGVPSQRIHPAGSGPGRPRLPVLDLYALPAEPRESEALRIASTEARQGFDLERGPLVRAALLRTAGHRALGLFTLHHLVSDGWSMGVLVREIGESYRALRESHPPRLPRLPIQYADYAVWQRELLEGEGADERLAEWVRPIAGAPPLLELPLDRPRPALRSFRGGRRRFAFDGGAAGRYAAIARREAATPFMVSLAAFLVWLSRLSGQRDLVIGTPSANRNRPEIEPLIGFFVNTLLVRAEVEADSTFIGLLSQVREATLGASLYQDLPFERLVDIVQPERSLSHTPLFQVMFAYQNAPTAAIDLPGLSIEPLDLHSATSKFDFTLELMESSRGLEAVVEFSTDLFDPATVERFASSLRILFSAVAEETGARLGELPVLSVAERFSLLYEEASLPFSALSAGSLADRIAARAAERPDALAVTFDGAVLTYGELLRRADALAARLLRITAVASPSGERRVALAFERSIEMIVAIVATLRAGVGYVPLDPEYPSERLEFLLADSGVGVVIAGSGGPGGWSARGVPVVKLDDAAEPAAGERFVAPAVDPDSAAYVIYTSGSTGKPKGVVVSHANVLRLFAATEGWFGFGEGDVSTMFHSYAFDFSIWEIFSALLYGGRLVVVPRMVARASEEFHSLLAAERVTRLSQTPSAFGQLATVALRSETEDLALASVVFGGEALDLALLAPWFRRFGSSDPILVNMYGITETTVHVTYRPIAPGDVGARSLIGRAIPDLRVLLLDALGELVPIGVAGEIHVGGAGVTRGYLNRAALTAERFVPDAFSKVPGARLYRSGDLARRLPDGDLEYLGRRDHQVKVRGFRIELGEIEAVLSGHPSVRASLALLRRDFSGEPRLVAYVASERQGGELGEELREAVRRRLPDYMMPSAIVVLSEFPLTVHGKVNRDALPLPGHERPDLASAYVAPTTSSEKALAAVWSEVLGVERVGLDDNFFALGGDSMRIVQVIARVREAGFVLAVQDLYRHQTIRALAAAVPTPNPEEGSAESPEEDDLDTFLAEVEGMSEDQAREWIEKRLRAPFAGGE